MQIPLQHANRQGYPPRLTDVTVSPSCAGTRSVGGGAPAAGVHASRAMHTTHSHTTKLNLRQMMMERAIYVLCDTPSLHLSIFYRSIIMNLDQNHNDHSRHNVKEDCRKRIQLSNQLRCTRFRENRVLSVPADKMAHRAIRDDFLCTC